jgi:hypothetical protein
MKLLLTLCKPDGINCNGIGCLLHHQAQKEKFNQEIVSLTFGLISL